MIFILLSIAEQGDGRAYYVIPGLIAAGAAVSVLIRCTIRQYQKAAEAYELKNDNQLIQNLLHMQNEQMNKYDKSQEFLSVHLYNTRRSLSVLPLIL